MDFSAALPTFAIALREGVEAALVVGIVLACLKKANASQLNNWVYLGIGAGIFSSLLIGLIFNAGMQFLSHSQQPFAPLIKPLLGTIFSIIAVAMLSWMLIWMTQQAKSLKSEVETAVTTALTETNYGAGWGVFSLIFIAVLREGFETVLFIFARFTQGSSAILGALAGLIVASLLGALLFKWGVKINLRLFFQIMGICLLFIVAGLVVSALKNLDAAAAIFSQMHPENQLCFARASCILGPQIWDTTNFLPDTKFPGVVLKALLGYRSKLYLLQFVAYVSYLITAGSLYFKSLQPAQSPANLKQKEVISG